MASVWQLIVASFVLFPGFCQATYSASARTNLALYWGQGPYQQRLLHFCQQSTVDIIPLAFVDIFPAQGNGFPGDNFGNQCYGPPYVYAGPGNDSSLNQLQSQCPDLVADIPVCQSQYKKKLVLSLGGGLELYGLTGAANGTAFADFMWGAFGPQTKEWLARGLPRPFDGPNNQSVEVDGFDFDIEFPSADNQAGYIAMIERLREHFKGSNKQFLITGAPQCVVPDANMGQMISQTKFDIIWVQYYNTAQCSARNWITANPNYMSTGVEEPSGFSFNAWERFLVGTASSNAKLYIGLPGSTGAAGSTYYLTPTEASSLIKAYYCKPNFGGIMIWEATYADNNNVGCGETYYQAVKEILVGYSQDGTLDCVVPPASPPPTSSKSSCTVSSTTTSTTTSASSTITPTPPCTEVYVVVSGDYCYLIWTEFGITEAQLYAWNPTLDANCDLQIGQVLCVAESSSSSLSLSTTSPTLTTGVSQTSTSASASATPTTCTEYHTVVSGDYCYLIWTEFGITEAQLYAFNPTLDANCDLSVGQVLCVSESPTSTSSSLSSTTASSSSSASSTPSACTKYYTVVNGDYCYLIYTEFGITEAQLYAFNPTLDANCDLSVGQLLCVSESPTSTSASLSSTTVSSSSSASPTPSTCTEYYTVAGGDYCYLIYTEFGITEAQLYAFNPTLDSNCDLFVGQMLCVSESPTSTSSSSISTTVSTTSSSVSPSPTASCSKYYTVQPGDYCYLIYTEFGITEAQLFAYNPTLDANCDLAVGQVLCVSEVPSSSSSTTLTPSSTTSSSSTSTATAACTQYYTVQPGDYCYLIYTEFGITEAQLYAFNPSLDTSCDLYVGQILCISESPLSSSSSSVISTSSQSTSTSSSSISSTSSSLTSSSSNTGSKSSTSSAPTSSVSSTSTSSSQTPVSSLSSSSSTYSGSSSQASSSSSISSTTSSSSSTNPSTTSSISQVTTSSSSITSSILSTTSSKTSSVPTSKLICNEDNCLRQLQHSSATAFCSTYTATINTASTGLPASVNNCKGSYSRISSACACLASLGSSTTSSSSLTTFQTSTSISSSSSLTTSAP